MQELTVHHVRRQAFTADQNHTHDSLLCPVLAVILYVDTKHSGLLNAQR